MNWIVRLAFLGLLAISAGCTQMSSGRLTDTGTGRTPSGGIVPAQTPE